jgi:GT2 family glycosyltransferase
VSTTRSHPASEIPAPSFQTIPTGRPTVRGKFIYQADAKVWIKGVTYGTFRPDEHGNEFHNRETVERDFKAIAANGFNAVRTYTVPPTWLLDIALRRGLYVMAGLAWEQHVAFLETRRQQREIRNRLRAAVRSCTGHPAVFCYAIGNEIPAAIARWHGARRVEEYLRGLWSDAKSEDSGALFTYVNYPSTEYLDVDFADLFCFNVYLEDRDRFGNYLARLHNLAGDRPLILAELGLDSLRHGEHVQAEVVASQTRIAFAEGCAGAFVFSWTDEWHRGGNEISDWAFGLTDRQRRAKPVLRALRQVFADVPVRARSAWPRISVVVCSYNGAATIRECCEGLSKLEYSNYEVIVVDDGSTDGTAEIVSQYGFRLIRTRNRGLSLARNTGFETAGGEIVAYIDDDAYPDPHWLTYLAITFMTTTHVGAGGPNIPPPGHGLIADCVAVAPGGPVHVLVSDREAEHIPGCNMAFRKSALEAIGGFDARFRVAGDDVDLCWRLQQRGGTLGFNAAAVVWHHRRDSVRAYWKQQRGYGRAEALLHEKWPEKYNSSGHLNWAGRIYSQGSAPPRTRLRIFHGVWGSALFQSIYQPASGGFLSSMPLMPEWYLIIACLAVAAAGGYLWRPLLVVLPMLSVAIGATILQAARRAFGAPIPSKHRSRRARLRFRMLTAALHIIQPLARLLGRLRHGLTPWRRRGLRTWALPWPMSMSIWSERWRSHTEWLGSLETALRKAGACVLRGGDFDRWDLEVRDGVLGALRILTVVEEHGSGKQLVRARLYPRCSTATCIAAISLFMISATTAWSHVWSVSATSGILGGAVVWRSLRDTGTAMAAARNSIGMLGLRVKERTTVIKTKAPMQPVGQDWKG